MTDRARVLKALQRAVEPKWEPRPVRGATNEELDGFTKRTGLAIPADLREWLKIANGSQTAGPGGFLGIRPDEAGLNIESYWEWHPVWKERAWFAVAGDGCGDRYILATRREFGDGFPVFFIDQCDLEQPAYLVASDIWHFVVHLLEDDDGWPFNKEYMLCEDPDIVRFDEGLLPWNVS